MLSNTGTVSFYSYLFFVIIGLLSILFVYRLVKKENIESERLDKFLDYFKWVIVTLSISTVTLIVSDLFKEREQDIKELEYFDKYVNDVKNQNEPLVRLQLVKYFSIVAPSGEMKKSWTNYYEAIKDEYEEYKKAQEKLKKDTAIINPTPEQANQIKENLQKIELFEAPLTTNNTNVDLAKESEKLGFNYLLDKDVENAIKQFTISENSYNGYHQVYEISKYLRSNRAELSNPNSPFWNQVFVVIPQKYSWKMPEDIKLKFNQAIK